MVLKELLGLSDILEAQALSIYKPTRIDVVGKNKNFVFLAFQIMVLSLKGFTNSQKFLIMHFILSFSQNHLSREKNSWVPLTILELREI